MRSTLTALLLCAAAVSNGAAAPEPCPPRVSVLAGGDGRFDLPHCTPACQMGIDSFDAKITCGSLEIDYYSAFDATLIRELKARDLGVIGRERVAHGTLYWGRPVQKPTRVCAVLAFKVNEKEEYFHAFCTGDRAGALDVLLRIARSYRTSKDEDEMRRLCPYCG